MTDYTIEEVGYFNCETCGYLTVSFRLEGDPEETYRTLETDEYYNYAEKESSIHGEYHTKEWNMNTMKKKLLSLSMITTL